MDESLLYITLAIVIVPSLFVSSVEIATVPATVIPLSATASIVSVLRSTLAQIHLPDNTKSQPSSSAHPRALSAADTGALSVDTTLIHQNE